MKSTTENTNNLPNYFDYLGDWNPQFLREIKGRLKTKNVIATAAISIAIQFIVVINFLRKLPDASYKMINNSSEIIYSVAEQYSRYCTGIIEEKKYRYNYDPILCNQDMHDRWMINWQLFWFDIFVALSVISIALLLVLGTYFLINNAIAEKKQETLNLVRLSPQSASNILIGKILGVPILLYLFIGLGLPLHTIAALQAHIPLSLLIAFDLAIIASCVFFYSVGLLLSFLIPKSIIAWAIAVAIAVFLTFTTLLNTYKYDFHTETLLDWLLLFNPNNLILYLGKATGLPYHHFDYPDFSIFGSGSYRERNFEPIFLNHVLFYGQAIGAKIGIGIGLVISNYCLWTYWIWQGLKRRFYNPENTVISKQQSYWITGFFVATAIGFSLQDTNDNFLFANIVFLQFLFLIWCLGLTFALSPQRQTLEDWARYRHQMKEQGNILWRELVFGEKSPSTVAIAMNVLITTLYVIPALTIFSLEDKTIDLFWGLILSLGTILLCAALAQWILMGKSKHKKILATATAMAITIVPSIIYVALHIYTDAWFESSYKVPLAWLFTSFPSIAVENSTLSTICLAILGQWLAITLVSLQITKKLRQAGRSESYKIVNG